MAEETKETAKAEKVDVAAVAEETATTEAPAKKETKKAAHVPTDYSKVDMVY